jgi:hypothetical protein
MRVGIVVNYTRHDTTYAALKAAPVIRDAGYTVTLFDKDFKNTTPKLHSFWDSFLVDSKTMSFKEWTAELDVVVWFTYPDERSLEIASSNHRPNICVMTWDSVDDDTIRTIRDKVTTVTPTRCQKNYFEQRWDLSKVFHIPTPVNLPITTTKREETAGLDLIVASPGYQIRRVDYDKLMATIYQACENYDSLRVRILYSKKVATQTKIYLDKYCRWFGNSSSIATVDDVTGWTESPLIYATADVVLWPTQIDGFGYVSKEAMAMGTPVITYNALPMSTGILSGKNGFLVQCATHFADTGTPYALHDGPGIMEAIGAVYSNRGLLNEVKSNLAPFVIKEEHMARDGWSYLLDSVTTLGYSHGKGKD